MWLKTSIIILMSLLLSLTITHASTVELVSGSVQNTPVENGILEISVQPDETISGQITIETDNIGEAGNIAPLVMVWSWGAHETSFTTINGWIPIGVHSHTIDINLQAPSAPGVYYLTFAFYLEMTGAQVASLTNWQVAGSPHWNDEQDIADWNGDEYLQSTKEHIVTTLYEGAGGWGTATLPAAMVKISVGDYSTMKLTGGSISGADVKDGVLELGVGTNGIIKGSVSVEAHNTAAASNIAPLVLVWSWGAHETSFKTIKDHISTGTSTYDVPIDFIAPANTGEIYLAFAFGLEMTGAQVASLTNWRVTGNPHWDDGHDIADWSKPEYDQSLVEHRVTTIYEGSGGWGKAILPGAMIKLNVGNYSTAKLAAGSLNGVNIENNMLKLDVVTDQAIGGTISVEANNTSDPGNIAPLVLVWNWGAHETSFSTIQGHISAGATTQNVPVSLVAPATAGTYYITCAFGFEMNGSQVASLTNWRVPGNPHWNDGHDIADWGAPEFEQSTIEHRVTTIYEGTGGFGRSILPAAMIEVNVHSATPTITSISDIGNDQGRRVRVAWEKSWLDGKQDALSIRKYSLWRRIDPLPESSAQAGIPKNMNSSRAFHTILSGIQQPDYNHLSATPLPAGEWDFIQEIPAIGSDTYSVVAPTLADSTIVSGVHWSIFALLAHTDDHLLMYVSAIDSGCSIDNLKPHTPGGLSASHDNNAIEIAWEMVPDDDFNYYAIYRNDQNDLNPKPYATTIEPIFRDAQIQPDKTYTYKITAIDFSGNESEFSEEAVVLPVGVAHSNSIPNTFSLSQNYPNPFNSTTTIEYQLPKACDIELAIYNLSGQLIQEIMVGQQNAGYHSITWNANQVSSGLYYYKLTTAGYTAIKKLVLLK
ncbi:T9SS type A sorting domain-containing protein [candidate division KSB1 bacterium]|nr:T9SS type A sorting domain-containing protein [candidate division KSB1 bacterium]